MRQHSLVHVPSATLLALSLFFGGRLGAVDFIRGDINGDGVVSIADAHYLTNYLFRFGPPPECWEAADADNDEAVSIEDAIRMLNFLIDGDSPLVLPFPDRGADSGPKGQDGWLDCASYGHGEPLADPVAKLEVLFAVAHGGTSRLATITIAVSNSRPIVGYWGAIQVDTSVIQSAVTQEGRDLTPNGPHLSSVRLVDGRLDFGFITSLQAYADRIPAGQIVKVMDILVCLKEGTAAGKYPLILAEGELVDFESGRAIHPTLMSSALTVRSDVRAGAVCPQESSASSVDFIRGDTNNDRTVSIADAYFLLSQFYLGGDRPECGLTADADKSGAIDSHDVTRILDFLFYGDSLLAPPFPNPGPGDGTKLPAEWMECPSYGHGAPLEDAAAKLEILDAVAPGGENSLVTINVAVSNSTSIAGHSGAIAADPTLFMETAAQNGKDLMEQSSFFNTSKVRDGRLSFGLIGALYSPLPPGENVRLLEITACLRDGTPAGSYPLTLTEGELVDADSGRAIRPGLQSGTLTVLSDIHEGAICPKDSGSRPPQPVQPPPPIHSLYKLVGATAVRGSTVAIPLIMRADAEIQGFLFVVDFDEEVLQVTDIEKKYSLRQGEGYESYYFSNKNEYPGNGGLDEGYLDGSAVFSFTDDDHNLPQNVENLVVVLHFQVNPETQVTSTEVRFLDGAYPPNIGGGPTVNILTAFGNSYTPEFINAAIPIVPDFTLFIRGDANDDKKVDISDPLRMLSFLFLDGERPPCWDAADANDDGILDVSDPIVTLQFLFLGGPLLPPPSDVEGEDPTPDSLGCVYRS